MSCLTFGFRLRADARVLLVQSRLYSLQLQTHVAQAVHILMNSEVFIAVWFGIPLFWDVMFRRFEGPQCFHVLRTLDL
jgi:hypothetical protein